MSEYIIKCKELVGISGKTMQFPEYIDMHQEIVRCRDCRFSRIFDGKRFPGKKYKGMTYCINWGDGMQADWTKPDGYCHKAKPRGDA